MTPELWQRLKPLYEAALEIPVESRSRFVVKACGDQPELRRELEALLTSADEPTGSFDLPIFNFDELEASFPPAFSPGDSLLNRFRVVRLLGSGGMGEVYEVEDSHLQGVHIALKTIRPGIAANRDLRKRFEREVLLAREVVHPNLCPMYDIFHAEQPAPGLLFLTMKLLPGETLAARLKQDAPVTKEAGIAILNNISLGVAAIHAAGIVHRDIKTNNIMLNGAGPDLHLWITDFGLARAFQTDTTVSTRTVLAGTPGYLAPELSLGAPPSQATDLFALGVVLHEVFFTEKPKASRDNLNVVVSPRLAALNLPPYAASLITDCLSSDPSRRCHAFDEALKVIDPHRNIHPPGPRLWTRRRFAAASLTGVALAAGATWWKHDAVDAFVEDALHPLPQTRHVALLNWPRTTDAKVAPVLNAILSAIKSELARLEDIDHYMMTITPEDNNVSVADNDHLQETCDALGANLVFAATAEPIKDYLKLTYKVIEPETNRLLRSDSLKIELDGMTAVPEVAIHAAARLLSSSKPSPADPKRSSHRPSPEAYRLFLLAQSARDDLNDEKLEKAIDLYLQATEKDGKYALAYGQLAMAYCRLAELKHDKGDTELARANAAKALDLQHDLIEGHMAMAMVKDQNGDLKGALQEINNALKADPESPTTLSWQAQIYTDLNQWAKAEATYQRIIKIRPNYWLANNGLGVLLSYQGKNEKALDQFKIVCAAAQKWALGFNNRGSAYLQLGSYQDAIADFNTSLSLQETSWANLNLSMALRGENKVKEATVFALKATGKGRPDDRNWLELADCYASSAVSPSALYYAYKQADKVADLFLKDNPNDGPTRMRRALYKAKLNDPLTAANLLRMAESEDAGDIDSQICKARVLEALGHHEEAFKTIQACLSRGATRYQIEIVPDFRSLTRERRFLDAVNSQPTA